MNYVYLAIAIVGEVVATNALKACGDELRLLPIAIVIMGYATALFFLSVTLRSMPIGTAYAIWAGVGTALVVIAARLWHGQTLNNQKLVGITLIALGVIVVQLSRDIAPSKATATQADSASNDTVNERHAAVANDTP